MLVVLIGHLAVTKVLISIGRFSPFLFFMSMKRIIYFVFLALTLCACGDDNDDKNANPENNQQNNERMTLNLQNGEEISAAILEMPEKYGFVSDTALIILSRLNSESSFKSLIWNDGEGCFVEGSDDWNNKYIKIKKNSTTLERVYDWTGTPEGIVVLDGTEDFGNLYDSNDSYYVTIILNEDIVVKKLCFTGSKFNSLNYSEELTITESSSGGGQSIGFEVYSDDFSADYVEATSTVSWMSITTKDYNHKKGEVINDDGNVWSYSTFYIGFNMSKNTGSERTGEINMKIRVEGKIYSRKLIVIQPAYSSSGGGGNSGNTDTKLTQSEYQSQYNRWADFAQSTWKSYNLIKSAGGSYVALSSLASDYRSAQREMKDIRSTAAGYGYTLTKSEWETKSLP